MLGTEIGAEIMAEQQLELEELGPACTAESRGDGQTDPKLEIEEGWTSDRGKASDQRRVHIDPLVTSTESPGADMPGFEEGWTADEGRPSRLRKKSSRESAIIEDEDEYGTGTPDIELRRSQPTARNLSLKGPVDEARCNLPRIDPDSSERPLINLSQVRYI
jgi:hypothetical protein